MERSRRRALVALAALSVQCGSGGDDDGACYDDTDGLTGGPYTLALSVDDTTFSKRTLDTQNSSQVTLTLTNTGTKPHGFEVGCTTTSAPAGCPTRVCFPQAARIAPLAPGKSKTITFETPVPDGIIYPFKSSEADDAEVPGLNDGQWSLM